ncbi:hypothetical protein D3C71_1912930 [compost metagenome]
MDAVARTLEAPSPAMIAAVWVPCALLAEPPQVVPVHAVMRAARSGWVWCTPPSTLAMIAPVPFTPRPLR